MDIYDMPKLEVLSYEASPTKKVLITAEGFEERSLSFLNTYTSDIFEEILICKYDPGKKSRFAELRKLINNKQPSAKVIELNYNRFEPFTFELKVHDFVTERQDREVFVDISVMSKYMIMQVICSLVAHEGTVRIVYSEPSSYAPENADDIDEQSKALMLPSTGVQNIVRTPLLSSLIMQHSPTLLVAFLSFNEQLIRALLTECTPSRLFLINGVPSSLLWREKATNDLHRRIISEYISDNAVDDKGLLLRKTSTLNYLETFNVLCEIYTTLGDKYRIVLAPTGSKMQAVACALIKSCCEDIHIEYPTPESFFVDGYSSSEINQIHQLVFRDFRRSVLDIAHIYTLNG